MCCICWLLELPYWFKVWDLLKIVTNINHGITASASWVLADNARTTCGRRADNIVINGFGNHSIYLSHLIPLHGVRSKQDLCGILLNIGSFPRTIIFAFVPVHFLSYSLLKFWSGVKSKMEEWEFVEGPHYQSQSETGHNPCQSVDCPIYRNQSETEHSSQVTILRGFHHIQCVNLNHLPPSWLIGTWTYRSINRASIGIPPIW